MKTLNALPQLVDNGTPQFGQFSTVSDINFLDAIVTTPGGKPLSHAAKRRKANQFCFISLHHERYIIGVAVVNLSIVSNGFVYLYDKQTNQLVDTNLLNPLAQGTAFPTTPNQGQIVFTKRNQRITINFTESLIQLQIDSKLLQLNADIIPSTAPLCLCTRTDYNGWAYTQKQTTLSCSGTIKTDTQTIDLTPENCLAGIDWTVGYMSRETFWNWSSISAQLPHQPNIGLNLACGVNETSFTENACWLDNTLYNLPPTIFDYDHQHILRPWRIYSNSQLPTDRHVDLTFTPRGKRDDHTSLHYLASHFSQLIGTYTGTITLPNQTITLDNIWGLAEDHYAKW